MARYCLLGHVDPAKLDEYKVRHAAIALTVSASGRKL